MVRFTTMDSIKVIVNGPKSNAGLTLASLTTNTTLQGSASQGSGITFLLDPADKLVRSNVACLQPS